MKILGDPSDLANLTSLQHHKASKSYITFLFTRTSVLSRLPRSKYLKEDKYRRNYNVRQMGLCSIVLAWAGDMWVISDSVITGSLRRSVTESQNLFRFKCTAWFWRCACQQLYIIFTLVQDGTWLARLEVGSLAVCTSQEHTINLSDLCPLV